jgi:hypothetical protein
MPHFNDFQLVSIQKPAFSSFPRVEGAINEVKYWNLWLFFAILTPALFFEGRGQVPDEN